MESLPVDLLCNIILTNLKYTDQNSFHSLGCCSKYFHQLWKMPQFHTWIVGLEFKTLKEAIRCAGEGDLIKVLPGIHPLKNHLLDDPIIDKSLTIVGGDQSSLPTVYVCRNTRLNITRNRTTLRGLCLVQIEIVCTNVGSVLIEHCEIYYRPDIQRAISCRGVCKNVIIRNNKIRRIAAELKKWSTIFVGDESEEVSIVNNDMEASMSGIEVYATSAQICGNHVVGADERGINCTALGNITIQDNTVEQCEESGISLQKACSTNPGMH